MGSGKTSLLKLFASSVEGVAWVGQPAFIFPGTVEDNILFGRPKEQSKLAEVVGLCQLKEELER